MKQEKKKDLLSRTITVAPVVTPHNAGKRTRLAVAVRPCRGGCRSNVETGDGAQGQGKTCDEGSECFYIHLGDSSSSSFYLEQVRNEKSAGYLGPERNRAPFMWIFGGLFGVSS